MCEIAQAVFLKTSQLSSVFSKESRIINHDRIEVVMIAQSCQEKLAKEGSSDLEKTTCTEILKDITEMMMVRDAKIKESDKRIDQYTRMLKVLGVGGVFLGVIALANS